MDAKPQADMDVMAYEAPKITDHGDLVELTAAVSVTGALDGGSFNAPNHHAGPAISV